MVTTNELTSKKAEVSAILILASHSWEMTMSTIHDISRIRLRIVGAFDGDECWAQRAFKVITRAILAASTRIFRIKEEGVRNPVTL